MPIYAYKCSACGHAQDVLQKISDAPLSVCPQCGQAAFAKQVTAAGFQLKGSGWYVTDFRNNNSGGGSAKPAADAAKADAPSGDASAGQSGAASSAAAKDAPAPANTTVSAAPAGGGGAAAGNPA